MYINETSKQTNCQRIKFHTCNFFIDMSFDTKWLTNIQCINFCSCVNVFETVSYYWTFHFCLGNTSGKITSLDLTFHPMIGDLGSSTIASCSAQFNFDVVGCEVRFDFGFMTVKVNASSCLDLHQFFTLSPVRVSSAGKYSCDVSVSYTDDCRRNVPTRSSAASLTVKCA